MEWRHTVWPDAKLVYTAIAKVANTSIKSALLESFAPDVSRRNPHAPEIGYTTVRPERIGREYPDFCHMAVVRDPFDRLVSFWADKIDGDGMNDGLARLGFEPKMPFTEAVALACSLPDDATDPHIRSQCWLLLNRKQRLRTDLLLRFERLAQDWSLMSRIVRVTSGADLKLLTRRRVSTRTTHESYYDENTRESVARRYAADFHHLGYPTELGTAESSPGLAAEDPIWAAIRAAPSRGVLDLTVASADRAAEVERHGGYYLGSAREGAVGQLARLTALEARVPEAAFDVVIVAEPDLGGRQPHTWVAERFRATGRTVVEC